MCVLVAERLQPTGPFCGHRHRYGWHATDGHLSDQRPGGTWDGPTDNGRYAVTMQAGQVTDTTGTAVEAGRIGTFTVNLTPPETFAPHAIKPHPSNTGSTAHAFAVMHIDNVALDVLTSDSFDIRVKGPNGVNLLANYLGMAKSAETLAWVVTYSIPAPGGMWDYIDIGDYGLSMEANQVTDTSSNPVPSGVLGTFGYQTSTPDLVAPSGQPSRRM